MEIHEKIVELEKHFLDNMKKELTIPQYKEYVEMFKELNSKIEQIDDTGEYYNHKVIECLKQQNFHSKVVVCLFNCLKDTEVIKKHLTLYSEILYSLSGNMFTKIYKKIVSEKYIKQHYKEHIDRIIKNCLDLPFIIEAYILKYKPSEKIVQQLKKFDKEVSEMISKNYSNSYAEYYVFIKEYLEKERNNIIKLIDYNSELFCVLTTSHLLIQPCDKQMEIAEPNIFNFIFVLMHYRNTYNGLDLGELIQFTSKERTFILNNICSAEDAVYI